mgnify:CR=1 FL=1
MKTNFCSLIFWLFSILPFQNARAQQDFNLTAGTGTPEMVNVGVRMQLEQFQYGISIGTSPGYKNENFNASGDFYYHFAGRSQQTDLPPWYGKAGITYMHSEGEWEKRMNLLFVPRLGREFNVTPQFGISLEAGVMLMLVDRNTAKKERTGNVSGDLDLIGSDLILPSAGLKIYYRLSQ